MYFYKINVYNLNEMKWNEMNIECKMQMSCIELKSIESASFYPIHDNDDNSGKDWKRKNSII